MYNIFSNEQKEDMKWKYEKEYLSLTKIGELYGVSKTCISRIMKEMGVTIRKGNHTYFAEYDKFNIIDTPEKAYWLGFVAADGCVFIRETNASIIINISRQDKEHLEKFRKFMNSNVKIIDHIQNQGFSNNSEMSKIVFNSISMARDFIKAGVPNKKSLILKPPFISENLYLPYILGYFDGDGSIFSFNNGKEWGINIEGTKEILEWINSLLHISTKLEKRKNDGKNNYYIRCGGVDKPYLILKQLYDSVDVHLNRKYEKFKTLETVVFNRNIKNN